MFTRVYLHLPFLAMFTYIYTSLLVFTPVYLHSYMFTCVYL